MSNSADFSIQAEGLGKRYLVPRQHQAATRTVMKRVGAHLREFFPFMRHDEEDFFWALRDLSLEVKPGEILGILGRNGSGKSTLLKILSGVTQPTTGRALLRGRVGSLLEVGTGFHPDMTGRENVFMSGVLLGLKREEIISKFDEIVDFSGIEKFIDVPVKRYSSGMYVRLAYAVTSMLRSDILILDEVMAVGDVAFRKKSQKNIEQIAGEGRAILFVSHNARAVTALCTTGMILEDGSCVYRGSAKEAVTEYMRKMHHYDTEKFAESETTTYNYLGKVPRFDTETRELENRVLKWVSTHQSDGTPSNRFNTGEAMVVRVGYEAATAPDPYFAVYIMNEFAERVATIHSTHNSTQFVWGRSGIVECIIPDLRLGEGTYQIMLDFGSYGGSRASAISYDCVPNAATIHVELGQYVGGIGIDAYQGAVHKSVWRPFEG